MSTRTLTAAAAPTNGAAAASRAPTVAAVDPVPRAAAIVGLVGVATIHLAQIVPTMQQTPWLGAMFVVLTVATVALAGWLTLTDHRAAWALVLLVNAVSIAGYAVTRMFSTFVDHQDVGNWGEMLGVAALLVEGLLVVLAAHQVRRPWRRGAAS
jgi:hypothetical protein